MKYVLPVDLEDVRRVLEDGEVVPLQVIKTIVRTNL